MYVVEKIVMKLNIAYARELSDAQESYNRSLKGLTEYLLVELNAETMKLYESRCASIKSIAEVEDYVTKLENCPESIVAGARRAKGYTTGITQEWSKVESDYNKTVKSAPNVSNGTGAGLRTVASGAAVGGAIATLGPGTAMAIATTFGTASTGAAISGLGGAAAVNAAMAWLGGGAIAAGGAGMAGGATLLALFGPVGWSLAGASLLGGIFLSRSKNKAALEDVKKKLFDLNAIKIKTSSQIASVHALRTETDAIMMKLDNIHSASFSRHSDYNDKSFPKRELFSIIDSAKLLGKMTQERV